MIRCACVLTLLLSGGCTMTPRVDDAFPPGGAAYPWVRTGEVVWSGSAAEASRVVEIDAATWPVLPQRVWLAVYRHADRPQRILTVRAFAFTDEEAARAGFAHLRPVGAEVYRGGVEGAWLAGGVLFREGRLVWDIFGQEPSWADQLQASYVAALVLQRLSPEVAADPR